MPTERLVTPGLSQARSALRCKYAAPGCKRLLRRLKERQLYQFSAKSWPNQLSECREISCKASMVP